MDSGKMVNEKAKVILLYLFIGAIYFAAGGKYDGDWQDDRKTGKGI